MFFIVVMFSQYHTKTTGKRTKRTMPLHHVCKCLYSDHYAANIVFFLIVCDADFYIFYVSERPNPKDRITPPPILQSTYYKISHLQMVFMPICQSDIANRIEKA